MMKTKEELSNKKTTELVSQLGHEMREPIHAIMGYSEILMDESVGELNPKQLHYMQIIHEGAEAPAHLADEFLDYNTNPLQSSPVKSEAVAPIVLLKNLEASFKLKTKAKNLAVFLPKDNSDKLINSDKNRIRRIIQVLIDNAIKYTAQGGTITLYSQESGDNFCFTVEDNGTGIEPSEQEAIFMPFYRGSNRTLAKGTGLGLSMASKLARDLGGSLEVDSQLGKGTKFTLVIPLDIDVSFPQNEHHDRVLPEVLTVLNEDNSALCGQLLEKDSFSWRDVPIKRIVHSVRHWNPLAVVVDDGFFEAKNRGAREQILADPLSRRTPVFVMSAKSNDPFNLKVKRMDADSFLQTLNDEDVSPRDILKNEEPLHNALDLAKAVRWEEEKAVEHQGFYGYTQLVTQISRELSRARREQTEASVLLLSLIGMPMKLEILSLILQSTRHHDFICPLNEYAAVFLPNTGEHSAEVLGSRLKEDAKTKFGIELEYVHSTFPHEGVSVESLINLAWEKLLHQEPAASELENAAII